MTDVEYTVVQSNEDEAMRANTVVQTSQTDMQKSKLRKVTHLLMPEDIKKLKHRAIDERSNVSEILRRLVQEYLR